MELEHRIPSELKRYNIHGIAHVRVDAGGSRSHNTPEYLLNWIQQPTYAWLKRKSSTVILASKEYKGAVPDYAVPIDPDKALVGIRRTMFEIVPEYK